MEGNIPYRSLKCLKAHSISTTSERLLKPIFRNRSQIKEEKNKPNIMNQNVTQYEYMLSQPYLKQNYINWATNLRAYDPVQIKQNLSYDAPSVFFKQTKLEQLRQQQKKKTQSNHLNVAEYSQYFGKDCTNISENQLNFVNELRKFQLKVKQGKGENKISHAQMFNSNVHKQNNLPKLLKKSAIKKIKGINQNDFQIALDGRHKFPEYTYKNLRQKNSTLIQALSKGSKSNLSLPGIRWSVGLRSY